MSDGDSSIKQLAHEVRELRGLGRHIYIVCSSQEILCMYKVKSCTHTPLAFCVFFLLIQMVDYYTHCSELLYFENFCFLNQHGETYPFFFFFFFNSCIAFCCVDITEFLYPVPFGLFPFFCSYKQCCIAYPCIYIIAWLIPLDKFMDVELLDRKPC